MAEPPPVLRIVPGRTRRGDVFFSVVVKRSYAIRSGARAERLAADAPLREVDSYHEPGSPPDAVIEHEHDLAPAKAAADIVVVGAAYAPGGRPVTEMAVGVQVGRRRKVLRITGERRCVWRDGRPPAFTDPEPFVSMPIRYDRAYGGVDEVSDANLPFRYPRNDLGRGVALRNVREAVDGLALPNVEDPDDLLTPERVEIGEPSRWPQQPLPQSFGWRPRTWYPRSALLGAWPPFLAPGTVTPEERLGMLPPDHVALAQQMRLAPMEERFANGASTGLVADELRGDEAVALRGLHPHGAIDFVLPGDTPGIALDTGDGAAPLDARVHTVSIRPDDLALDIVWCGSRLFGPASRLGRLKRLVAEVH